VKIPSERVDLEQIGFPGYWIEVPRSIKEGFLQEFLKLGAATGDGNSPESVQKTREANIKLLEQVSAWNIDDDEGNVLPVMGRAKNKAEKERVLGELPINLITFVAGRLSGSINVPEKVQDF
jgi:hypothetical protein